MPESTVRGMVHSTAGGVYRVSLTDGTVVDASIRGRLKRKGSARDRVVIGDRVILSREEDAHVVAEVEPRENTLARRGREGRAPKVLAANLHTALAVVALREPSPSFAVIDRLLVLIEASGLTPSLVLNKADTAGAAEVARELRAVYEEIGYSVYVTSALTGAGIEELKGVVCRGVSALIGPSGVGKSSLLNAIDPALDLKTGELSRKTGTGRHTTVGSRLIPLTCGGLVADTPGFGDVGLWRVPPEEIGAAFPELAAVEEGTVPETRYESYRVLREEAERDATRW